MDGKTFPRYYSLDGGKIWRGKLLFDTTVQCLFKMGKMTLPNCIYDDAATDDVEYTFFHCERWRFGRRNLEAKIGACTIENSCDVILGSNENWNSIVRPC